MLFGLRVDVNLQPVEWDRSSGGPFGPCWSYYGKKFGEVMRARTAIYYSYREGKRGERLHIRRDKVCEGAIHPCRNDYRRDQRGSLEHLFFRRRNAG